MAKFDDERILTVYEFLTPSYEENKYSRILLQGKWLRDLGFKPGDKVSVQVANPNNKIELFISHKD